MTNDYFGKWVAFQRQGKIAVIHILEKNKPTGFKVFDNNNTTNEKNIIDKFEKLFKLHEGKEIKVIASDSKADEYQGKLKASELICFNLVIDESAHDIPEPEQPDIQVENHHTTVDDELDILPF